MATNTAIYEIQRHSLSDQVYDYIKRLILSGEIRGGEKIPEEKVAQQFGVSRTPIREALSRLEEYGLIKIKPRSYAEVVALEPHESPSLQRSDRNWKPLRSSSLPIAALRKISGN